MKKFISGLIIGIIAAISINAFAVGEHVVNANPFPVIVNGIQQIVDAFNIDGFTYVKLADVGKSFNGAATVKFDEIKSVIEINTVTQAVYSPTGGTSMGTPVIPTTTPVQDTAALPDGATYVNYRGYPNAVSYNGKIYVNEISYFKIQYKGPDMWMKMEDGKNFDQLKTVRFNRDTDTTQINGKIYVSVDSFSSLLD